MVDEKKLKELTIKYFIEQKKEEIIDFATMTFKVLVFVGIALQIGWMPNMEIESYQPIFPEAIMITGLIIIFIGMVYEIYHWIKSNWETAKSTAEFDLTRDE